MSATHAQLVVVARKWLEKRCPIVISEVVTSGETPDALGWRGGYSIVIECKTSTQDFAADARKFFRRNPGFGVGDMRYFLAPRGLLSQAVIPHGWGLLEYDGRKVREVRPALRMHANHRQEIRILTSLLRRIGQSAPVGVSIRCYVTETKCKACLGIAKDGIDSRPSAGL